MRFTGSVLVTFLELGGELCAYMLAHIQLPCSVHMVPIYKVVWTEHQKIGKR